MSPPLDRPPDADGLAPRERRLLVLALVGVGILVGVAGLAAVLLP